MTARGEEPGSAPTTNDLRRAGEDAALDRLRVAFGGMLGAERRLRGREGHSADALSLAHYRLLICLLDADGGLPAGRLAAAADLTPATTTQMLDVLERRGLVQRSRHATDRRSVLACLTGEGRRLTLERRASFRALWEEVLGDLDEGQLETGIVVLGRVAEVLETLAERKAAAA